MNTPASSKAGSPRAAIARFWRLHELGRSAALDINTETGELACLATISDSGAEGLGTPGQPYSDCWTRVVQTNKGSLGPSK
jgi:hypothetical protein